jgi:dihydrofolate reductase
MHTVLIAVASIDGCITKHNGSGAQSWASPEDQVHFRASTATCDVRVFGSATYRPDREWFLRSVRPGVRRIVMTSRPDEFLADQQPGLLEFTDDQPDALLARLRADGHQRCAVLGGGAIYGAFLGAGLVDEIELSLEPLIFGSGVRLGGQVAIDQRFELADVTHLNSSTLLLRYRRSQAE